MGAAIYARISLDRLDGEGVERQLADCRALAAEHGHHQAAEYVDNDVSAFRAKRRPAWDRLLEDLRAGQITHLFAYHPDRLYRKLQDLEDLIDATSSTEVHTVKAGEVDLSNASGRMIARILGSVSRHESERMGERVRRAKIERAAQGRPAGGGKRPTGLDATRTHLVPDEADMLRDVARRLLAGGTWTGEARRLNQEGWVTTTGKAWTAGTLRRTLTSPYVAGLRTYRGEIVGDAVWPPILDRPTFDALRGRVGAPQGPRVQGKHLLTGLIRCAACDRRMYGNTTSTGWTYRCPTQESNGRGCGQSIMRNPTDRLVISTVTDWLAEPAFLAALRDHLTPKDDTAARVEVEQIERRLTDLARRFANGDLLEFEHAAARSELVTRRKQLLSTLGTRPIVDVDLDGLRDAWRQAIDADDLPLLRGWVGVVAAPILVHPRDRTPRVQIRPTWA